MDFGDDSNYEKFHCSVLTCEKVFKDVSKLNFSSRNGLNLCNSVPDRLYLHIKKYIVSRPFYFSFPVYKDIIFHPIERLQTKCALDNSCQVGHV